MEYMPLLLRQFLGGSAPDLPANEFKAYILALAHIYENEAPVPDVVMIRHLTGKGWNNARAGLVAKGRLFAVKGGGWMDKTALHVLRDYHAQRKLAEESGRKGAMIRAARQRERDKRSAAMDDLFANELQSASTAKKANEISEGDLGGLKHAHAHARESEAQIRDANGMQPGCIPNANELQQGFDGKNANDFNGSALGCLKQEEVEEEIEEDNLLRSSKGTTRAHAHTREDILSLWNSTALTCGWTTIRKIDDKRWKAIRARLKDFGEDSFKEALTRASRSSLLHPAFGDPPHWFDFDFIISPSGFAKTLEGKYDELRDQHRDPTIAAVERLSGHSGTR